MNRTSNHSDLISRTPSYGVSPFQTADRVSQDVDFSITQVAKRSFESTENLYAKLSDMQNSSVQYSKMSLYQFRKDDTLSSIAGRVALYVATFATGGLLLGGLLLRDLAHNSTAKKQRICDIVDQLASRVCNLRSDLSDTYVKMTGRGEVRPLWTRGETPSTELQGLDLHTMYRRAGAIVRELHAEIGALETFTTKLARNVGIEKKGPSSPLPSHVKCLIEAFDKNIASGFGEKVVSLDGDITSVRETLAETKLAIEEGHEYSDVRNKETAILKRDYQGREASNQIFDLLGGADLAQDSLQISPSELHEAITDRLSFLIEEDDDPQVYRECYQAVKTELIKSRGTGDRDLIDFS